MQKCRSMHSLSNLSYEIRPKIKLSSLNLRKCRGSQIFFCWKPSKWGEIHDALATLKPDHACLIPARLHQIGNCKKNCRHGSGVMPVVGRKLEGTFLDYPHFDLLFPCFQSFFSLRLMFLQVSFKILVQTSRH